MHRIREKHGAIAAAMLAVAGVLAQPMAAQVRSFHFDMRDQSLSQALQQYGQVSGQQIVFTEALVADLASAPLKGEFTAESALEHLLQGTGLIAERSSSGVFMIKQQAPPDVRPVTRVPAKALPPDATPFNRHADQEDPT